MPAECGQEFNIYGFPLGLYKNKPRPCYTVRDGDLHAEPGPNHHITKDWFSVDEEDCLHHTPGQTYSQSNLPDGYW